MASCLAVMGIIWLVITNLAIIICFSTPFWTEEYMFSLISNEGLWAKCGINTCVWFFENDFEIEQTKPGKFSYTYPFLGSFKELGAACDKMMRDKLYYRDI